MISSLQTNIHYHTSNCYDLMEVIYYQSLTVKTYPEDVRKMDEMYEICLKIV